MGFLDDLLQITGALESPRSYFLWAGIATLSAVVKNRIHVVQPGMIGGINELCPNLFIFLLGPSGLRKGVPVALSKILVNAAGGVRLISGRSSIQAIIKELGTSRTTRGSSTPVTDASAYLCSGEMSTSLVRDEDALTILTDLYDGRYNHEWKNTLKYSGVEALKNVNLTLLGALNPEHFEDLITGKEIYGGFVARSLIISETQKARTNSLLGEDDAEDASAIAPDIGPLTSFLKEAAKLKGPFKIEKEARAEFNRWYHAFDEQIKKGEIEDKTGTANRIHDHVLKLAQLLAVSRECALHMTMEDVEYAVALGVGVALANIKPITNGIGEGEDARKSRLLLRSLLLAPGNKLWKSKILRKHYADFNTHDLARITETWVDAGILIEPYGERVKGGGRELVYELVPGIADELLGRVKKEA